jgi:hypothetical protein
MYGLFPENQQEAIAAMLDKDVAFDCHQHCVHWESEGECCECGEIKRPEQPLTYTPEGLGEDEPIYTSGRGL